MLQAKVVAFEKTNILQYRLTYRACALYIRRYISENMAARYYYNDVMKIRIRNGSA